MKHIILIIAIVITIACENNITKYKEIEYKYYTNYYTNYQIKNFTNEYTNYYTNKTVDIFEFKAVSTITTEYEYIYKLQDEYYYTKILTNKITNEYFKYKLTLEKNSKYEIKTSQLVRTYPNGTIRQYKQIY